MAIEWREGKLAKATITADATRECVVAHAEGLYRVVDGVGLSVGTRANGHRLAFDARAGETYGLVPSCRQ